MPAVYGGGVAVGVGSVAEPTTLVTHWLYGSPIAGQGTVSSSEAYVYLFSGYAAGHGEMADPFVQYGAGTASGAAVLPPPTPIIQTRAYGYSAGMGFLGIVGAPMAIQGQGTVSAYVEVVHLAPLCPPSPCRCKTNDNATMRWGQTLGPGDLWVRFREGVNPISPYSVCYTLYRRLKGGYEQQVGASCRCAASSKVGEFYAPWTAQEGQPGEWVIVWSWQRTAGGATQTMRSCFSVHDAAMANEPTDCTPRVKKYGWSD
jgi:hypothetical protein